MDVLQGSAVIHFPFLMIDSTDHITGKSGLTPTVTLSKNAGAFAAPAGAITEIANGWYKLAANATDSNTLGPLVLHASAAGADPTDVPLCSIVSYNPQDAVHLGISALPNAAANAAGGLLTFGTGAGQLNPSSGAMPIVGGLKKNTAQRVPFFLTDLTNHNPFPSATSIVVTRSIDGAPHSAGTITNITEVGGGDYYCDFLAADANGDHISVHASAAGADLTAFILDMNG